MKTQICALISLVLLATILTTNFVMAVDFDESISREDQQTFDGILEPVMKVYNLVKYTSTVLAVVVLLFAGISYMTSGGDPGKREKAKSTAMYVVVGLVVIWAAPELVNFLVG